MVSSVSHTTTVKSTEKSTIVAEVLGQKVKELITKFFYRDNHLCLHILLQLEGGETVFLREFTDYAEYKKAFSDLQQAKRSNAAIHIPKKSLTTGPVLANVA